ncbi:MAG: F0F1 ATP synthase subunit [Planctomycetaceae bacterium]|nr:MAG: F0F1 ATP synthase subunit [Planctomycetaceae bacterium]
MNEKPEINSAKNRTTFSREVGVKAARKLKALRNPGKGVWFGLGMMGLIGWSVVVPTLLGAALGFWVDKRHSGSYSWTLMLLLIGLVLGCVNAWHWMNKEDKEMREEQENNDE